MKKYENALNFKETEFSVGIKDIDRFQKQNPDLSGINVFTNEGKTIKPIIYTKKNRNDDIALDFENKLNDITKEIYHKFYKFPKKMKKITDLELKTHEEATECYIYNNEFTKDNI